MTDFAVPNAKPGTCAKCNGKGEFWWGAIVNGQPTHRGTCWSCKGTGKQTYSDIKRNITYNKHKIVHI